MCLERLSEGMVILRNLDVPKHEDSTIVTSSRDASIDSSEYTRILCSSFQ